MISKTITYTDYSGNERTETYNFNITKAEVLEMEETQFPTLQADSLSAEPQGKPKNTGVGSLSLLQGIFLSQELNWGLLHCRWILHQRSHKGSPRTLDWVAMPSSRGSSQPRDQIQVSCIAGGFFAI